MTIVTLLQRFIDRSNLFYSWIKKNPFSLKREDTKQGITLKESTRTCFDYKRFEQDPKVYKRSVVNLDYDDRALLPESFSSSIAGSGARLVLEVPDRVDVYFREYQSFDPISMIDWKAYARSDELLIRQTKKQAHLNVLVAIDRSLSMSWSYSEKNLSKEEISYKIAGTLSKIHLKQEDLVWFCCFDEKKSDLYKLKTNDDTRSLFKLSEKKEKRFDNFLPDEGKFNFTDRFEKIKDEFDLIYVFSDALDKGYKNYLSSKAIFFHVLSVYELDPRWIHPQLVYYSKKPKISYSGVKLLDNNYLSIIDNWMSKVKKESLRVCEYILINEMVSIDELFYNIDSIFNERRNKR